MGKDVFVDPEEREEYDDLNVIITNLELELPPPPPPFLSELCQPVEQILKADPNRDIAALLQRLTWSPFISLFEVVPASDIKKQIVATLKPKNEPKKADTSLPPPGFPPKKTILKVDSSLPPPGFSLREVVQLPEEQRHQGRQDPKVPPSQLSSTDDKFTALLAAMSGVREDVQALSSRVSELEKKKEEGDKAQVVVEEKRHMIQRSLPREVKLGPMQGTAAASVINKVSDATSSSSEDPNGEPQVLDQVDPRGKVVWIDPSPLDVRGFDAVQEPPSKPGVSVASPPAVLDSSVLTDGWMPFSDGMALGSEPNSVVLPDGYTFGPQSVEVDSTTYNRPIWRYRRVTGAAPVGPKGVIPVREAFQSLLTALAHPPMSAAEWVESSFPPSGARASRAFTIGIDDSALVGGFLSKVPSRFRDLADDRSPRWEEATGPLNVVPDSVTVLPSRRFVEVFGRPKIGAKAHQYQLRAKSLPDLPSGDLEAEFEARLAFRDALNIALASEGLLLQWGSQDPHSPSMAALLKLSLRPL